MPRMLSQTLMFVALSVLLFPGQSPVAQEGLPAPTGPTAEEILDKAIAFQGPAEFAVAGSIRDLTVRLSCDVWDYSKTEPEKVSLGVSRFLSVDPLKFRSEWRTSVDVQVYGFDGRRYWYQDKDGAQWLTGGTKADTRNQVKAEIAETKHLLHLFFLANLKGSTVKFKREEDASIEAWGKTHDCYVIRRDNVDPESNEPPLTIAIDKKTLALVRATAHATSAGNKSLSFIFRNDERVQPRVKGVLFPFQIEVREKPFGAAKDRQSLIATLLEEGGIEFNTGIDAKRFLRPR